MKRLLTIILFLSLAFVSNASNWTVYPALGTVDCAVEGGSRLWVLATGNLFAVNTNDESVMLFDKATQLSDAEIDYIAWCDDARRLVVVYSNQNIDLIDPDGNVTNMPEYKQKTLVYDKTINGLDIYNSLALLSTGFGLVIIDVAKAEVQATVNLGFAVQWSHVYEDFYYMVESKKQGAWICPMRDNVLDSANWVYNRGYRAKEDDSDEALMAKAESYKPVAPTVNLFGVMRVVDGTLYTLPGQPSSSNRVAAVQVYDGSDWTVVDDDTGFAVLAAYRNFMDIAVDGSNPNHWVVGSMTGLYLFDDQKITAQYNYTNSLLETAASLDGDYPNYNEVTTLCADSDGNYWLLQGYAATPGIIRYGADGSFTRFEHNELYLSNYGYGWALPVQLDFSSDGLLWFVNNNYLTPALASYDIVSDEMTAYTSFVNEDNATIEFNYMRCWAEDQEGNIWLGTDYGPFYLPAESIGDTSALFEQVKIPRADDPTVADYMLSGVDITAIAVDAANRKWFATDGQGIYVMSSDCMTQEANYTADNSPLLSNYVESLAIDPTNDIVYIGTSKGLCSYASDATIVGGELKTSNILAYPNPVRPEYTGLVTITGLSANTDVKIVTSSGHLVADGTAQNGTFQWDTYDRQGRRCASGVYIILATSEDQTQRAHAKVAIVR